MTTREQQILALIRDNPLISQDAIAEKLEISRSAVAGHIMRLGAKGVIKGRGYVLSEKPFAAVIGGANMDICGASTRELRMQDSNPGTVSTSPGGVARNIAENLARLGVDCRLIAAIGADHHGELLLRQGKAAGIDMRYVVQLEAQQTSTYVSILDDAGDMLVGINDMDIVNHLLPERLQVHEQMLRQASVLITDTNLCEDSLAYISGTCVSQPLFVDTVSVAKATRLKAILDRIHTLKASRIEAEALCGMRAASFRQLPKLAGWLHERGVARVFITLGPNGVFYSDGESQGRESVQDPAAKLANANGAGDAFTAGLVFAWLQDTSLMDSVRLALAAAQVAMAHHATINPSMSAATINRITEAHNGS